VAQLEQRGQLGTNPKISLNMLTDLDLIGDKKKKEKKFEMLHGEVAIAFT
jgi:hypothetical protein